MKNKITIKDVARESGFSISTVSNTLNNVDVVNPETRAKILEVANKLNYVPDINGKLLKGSKSNTIGLFVTNLSRDYYSILVDQIYDSCLLEGYELHIFITSKKESVISNIMTNRIDGAIIMSEYVDDATIETLISTQKPIVFLDREIQNKNISSVIFNSYQAGLDVGEYLLSLNKRHIIYVQGYDYNTDSNERLHGLTDSLKSQNVDLVEVLTGKYSEEHTYYEINNFLESGKPLPEVFVCANDLSAIGCIKALTKHNINVPEQVGVIGFDNIEKSAYISPKLTTYSMPIVEQAVKTCNLLISKINKPSQTSKIIKLDGELKKRKSIK